MRVTFFGALGSHTIRWFGAVNNPPSAIHHGPLSEIARINELASEVRLDKLGVGVWRSARGKAGLPHVRVHDLKHTFGQRLRAAGVTFEDRQDLLGHRSKRMTTHYSAAELSRLLDSADRVCKPDTTSPEVIVLRGALRRSRKTPATLRVSSG